eukprot:scaffold8943_cov20-Tisochrysis_lutea.AAC.3
MSSCTPVLNLYSPPVCTFFKHCLRSLSPDRGFCLCTVSHYLLLALTKNSLDAALLMLHWSVQASCY